MPQPTSDRPHYLAASSRSNPGASADAGRSLTGSPSPPAAPSCCFILGASEPCRSVIFLSGLLLLTALGLGLVGYQVTRPPKTVTVAAVPEAPPPPLTIDVLVAARGLPAGTLMKDEDFTKRAVPSADVPKGALTDTPEVARRTCAARCCATTSMPATSSWRATCCTRATAASSPPCWRPARAPSRSASTPSPAMAA